MTIERTITNSDKAKPAAGLLPAAGACTPQEQISAHLLSAIPALAMYVTPEQLQAEVANAINGQRKPMTPRQLECFNAIARHIIEAGCPPTFEELGSVLKITRHAVWDRVDALKKKGWVTCEKHKARSIQILCPSSDSNTKDPEPSNDYSND